MRKWFRLLLGFKRSPKRHEGQTHGVAPTFAPHYGIRSDEVSLVTESADVGMQGELVLSKRIPEQAATVSCAQLKVGRRFRVILRHRLLARQRCRERGISS